MLNKLKPRILLLPDKPEWAFDLVAKQITRLLGAEYEFVIKYIRDRPSIEPKDFDLFYVFWWGEQHHRQFSVPPERLIKEVSSYRWMHDPPQGPLCAEEMVQRYLREAATVTCTSRRMLELLQPWHPYARFTPNGFDPAVFHSLHRRSGPLRIGWAGSAGDPVKGIVDILRPACAGRFELREAPGNLGFSEMNDFYNSIDVLAIASRHEGQPLPLMEAMAAGCFVVTVDVGIVPEIVVDGVNGLVIGQRTPEAFREAFDWCAGHLEEVRLQGRQNAEELPTRRSWDVLAAGFRAVFEETLVRARRPMFTNADVSVDVDINNFKEFCRIFWRQGHALTHGVTLRGRTSFSCVTDGQETEYEGIPGIATIANDRIRALSEPWKLEDRADLVAFLRESPGEIALHGLYHTDYSQMTKNEQRQDIREGLRLLHQLFPRKMVRHFIPPFDRTSKETRGVCEHFGLHLLEGDGIGLENDLERVVIAPEKAYQCRHHHFFSQNRSSGRCLSLERLNAALGRTSAPAATVVL
jgi:hypothetical protein